VRVCKGEESLVGELRGNREAGFQASKAAGFQVNKVAGSRASKAVGFRVKQVEEPPVS
jgi:hypothetical protein